MLIKYFKLCLNIISTQMSFLLVVVVSLILRTILLYVCAKTYISVFLLVNLFLLKHLKLTEKLQDQDTELFFPLTWCPSAPNSLEYNSYK